MGAPIIRNHAVEGWFEVSTALYIVATPIGNLGDITERALAVLKDADVIAAEDTRRAGKLLEKLGIRKKEFISYFDHVEKEKAPFIVQRMVQHELKVALISDAGTPCISDPGFRLVAEARRQGVPVIPVPGASALSALVSVSGLPNDRFLFIGFLPSKMSARQKEIKSWQNFGCAVVFYESPRRLEEALQDIEKMYPHAQICVGRELTKLHEETLTGSVHEIIVWARSHDHMKGELVVMFYPGVSETMEDNEATRPQDAASLRNEAIKGYRKGKTLKDLLQQYSDAGFSRSDLYRILLEAKSVSDDDT